MIDKNNIISFLLGLIIGVFLTCFSAVALYGSYKLAKKFLNDPSFENKIRETVSFQNTRRNATSSNKPFSLSFETKEEAGFFDPADGAYIEQSSDHVADAKKSLMVEFPKGAAYPGLSWEVYRKDQLLNFSSWERFVFEVYNNSEIEVPLILKIKSGAQYPKKSIEIPVSIPPLASKAIHLSISDLRNSLGVDEISYIKIYVAQPSENITLFFDHFRVENTQLALLSGGDSFEAKVIDSLDKVIMDKKKVL